MPTLVTLNQDHQSNEKVWKNMASRKLDVEIANCYNLTIVICHLGSFGQALCIRSCHEDLTLTRKSHNCTAIAFNQGDSA